MMAQLDKALTFFLGARPGTNSATVDQDVREAREALAAASRVAF
jgi:hypothetical protein